MVIGFHELPDEDQPPAEMWLDDQRLVDWFDAVRQRHRAGAGLEEPMEEVPMTQNELTEGLRDGE